MFYFRCVFVVYICVYMCMYVHTRLPISIMLVDELICCMCMLVCVCGVCVCVYYVNDLHQSFKCIKGMCA